MVPKLDAREFVNLIKSEKRVIRVCNYVEDECNGRSNALILDKVNRIAVMLEDCGHSTVKAGHFISYVYNSEANENKISGCIAVYSECNVN